MRTRFSALCVLVALATAVYGETPKRAAKAQDGQAIVIVFKNGHQESFPMADIARIEFPGSVSTPAASVPDSPGRGHFLGKWKVGEGNGSNFYITLMANGRATRSLHETHGTWTVVNNEARITWDDDSHDVIRKVGNQYEKAWYSDGTFSGKPNNVTNAELVESKPI